MARSAGSDTDICLVTVPGIFRDTAFEMELSYARPGLDVSVFTLLSLALRVRVLKEGQVRWTRDEDRLYDVAIDTMRRSTGSCASCTRSSGAAP